MFPGSAGATALCRERRCQGRNPVSWVDCNDIATALHVTGYAASFTARAQHWNRPLETAGRSREGAHVRGPCCIDGLAGMLRCAKVLRVDPRPVEGVRHAQSRAV